MYFFETMFEFILGMIPMIFFLIFFLMIYAVSKSMNSYNSTNKSGTTSNSARKYDGITRAGGTHYHKGSVGTTRKDEEWEETRCGKYKDEIFGKDVCNTYTPPDYDSLSCEDEDLSGR